MSVILVSKNSWMNLAQTACIAGLVISAQAGPDCPTRYTVEVITNPGGRGSQQPTPQSLNSQTVVGVYHPSLGGFSMAFTWSAITGFVPIQFPFGTLGGEAVAITEAGEIAGTYGNSSGNFGYVKSGTELITFTTLNGGDTIWVTDMNSRRQVIGYWGNSVDGPYPLAFLWDNGVMRDISSDLLGPQNQPNDINEAGMITGFMGPSLTRSAFVWNRGRITDLGQLTGSFNTAGNAINNVGQVCGGAIYSTGDPPTFTSRGFFWNGSMLTDLGTLPNCGNSFALDLDDHGLIVGYVQCGFAHAVIWQYGVIHDLNQLIPASPPLRLYTADAINDVGQITGHGRFLSGTGMLMAYRLTPAPPRLGDVTCDGKVNVDDLLGVINGWGICGATSCAADLNDDHAVNVDDLIIVIMDWG